jgi:hypothetical protein
MCTGRAPFSYRMEESDVFDGIPKIYSDRLRKCIAACTAFHSEDRHDAFDLLRVAQRARNDPAMRHLVPAPVLTSAPIVSVEKRDFNSRMISELPLTNQDGRTLDGISRIVTTEQAKEQRPNADQYTARQPITTPAAPATKYRIWSSASRIVTTEQAKEQRPNADQYTARQLITTPAAPAAKYRIWSSAYVAGASS